MEEVLSLPWYMYALPCGAIVGAICVSKLLRVSRFASLAGAMAPLALPYADLPQSSTLASLKPHYQVVGAWGVLLIATVGLVMIRSLYGIIRKRLGVVRAVYSVLLFGALVVVTLLFARPDLLQEFIPDWRQSVGGVLLAATLIGVGIASANVVRSATSLIVWSLASIVLASQIFFLKMPHEVEQADVEKIKRILPKGIAGRLVPSGIERLIKASTGEGLELRSASSDKIDS